MAASSCVDEVAITSEIANTLRNNDIYYLELCNLLELRPEVEVNLS